MARFYAEIEGNRGPASRMGSKDSGMWSHTRGWHLGAQVDCDVYDDDDVVGARLTGGSSGFFSGKPMFTARERKVGKGKRERAVIELTVEFPSRRTYYLDARTGQRIRKPRSLTLPA